MVSARRVGACDRRAGVHDHARHVHAKVEFHFSDVHQRWTVTAEILGMGNMCLISPPGAQDWTPAQVGACSYLGIEYYHSWTIDL